MKIFGYLITTVIGILIGLFIKDFYKEGKKQIRYLMRTQKQQIKLFFEKINDNEKDLIKLKYCLLLVRFGRDEVEDRGEKLLEVSEFTGTNPKTAKLKVHNILGAQFKCYIDYKEGNQLYDLKNFLERNGFIEISHDDDKSKNRLWFIHPGYGDCRTINGFINNFVHPMKYKKEKD